ncbi:MAG: tetratricopeptide repeat protein [Prolixibacteraceae bacterium]|nr:tetratricopeptide repeat protein [Prolixibacteraceae bacterium]
MNRVLITCCLLFATSILLAQNITMAKDMYDHGLKEKATEEFIKIYYNNSSTPALKAEALYYMGELSCSEAKYETAIKDWTNLIKLYPNSKYSLKAKESLDNLKDTFGASITDRNTSLLANQYFKNAEFFDDSPSKYTIDGSYLPSLPIAIYWYDRVIDNFPKSPEAEVALEKKIKCLINEIAGEKKVYLQLYKKSEYFDLHMPKLLETYNALELDYPDNSSLNAIRYQISQIYWYKDDIENASLWLNNIINKNKTGGFYTKLAEEKIASFKKKH